VFFPLLLYFCLLFYFLVVFLPFGVCSPILFVGVRVLINAIDPTFLNVGSILVLSARVPKGFLLVIIVLPMLAALCGRPCSLYGPDHSFDPFPTIFWISYGGDVLWLVQGYCLGCPPFVFS
jgi:hypothetical protein